MWLVQCKGSSRLGQVKPALPQHLQGVSMDELTPGGPARSRCSKHLLHTWDFGGWVMSQGHELSPLSIEGNGRVETGGFHRAIWVGNGRSGQPQSSGPIGTQKPWSVFFFLPVLSALCIFLYTWLLSLGQLFQ